MASTSASKSVAVGIPVAEYAERRRRLAKLLGGAAAVVFAGEGSAPLLGRWRADANFRYLTGIDSEPGAAVLFDPKAENPRRRIALFLKPRDPEAERWDGYREPIATALKRRTGFESIFRATQLPAFLTSAARRAKLLACLHRFAVYPAGASPDLAIFREVAQRVHGVTIEDRTDLLPSMRAVKSSAELGLMRRAVAATAAGYAAALPRIRPGVSEAVIARALEQTYVEHGADGVAYNSIVGSGLNGTVLHYMDNKATLHAGDLLVIDSAASFASYAADVTRTLPVGGRFSAEHREAYEVVLKSQLASIRACRPGATMTDVDDAARAVIDKAGFGDAFIHSIGHPLGLEVHDAWPDGPLKAGMVVTIEPGIYLPDRKFGIRIEDDILVTRKNPENLTSMIPKSAKDVEAAMR